MTRLLPTLLIALSLTGCATIRDWWPDNPIPTPEPTPQPSADGFVFGEWEWMGGLPCSRNAMAVPPAEIKTATIIGSRIHLTYGSDAKTQQWWTPYDGRCYGVHALAYRHTDGKWLAGYVDWYALTVRDVTGIENLWKDGTPFAGRAPVRGCDAYWWAYQVRGGTARSNVVKVEWK